MSSQGALANLYTEPGASPHTFDTSSEPFCFIQETLSKHGRIVDANGICGTRSHYSARTREGAYPVFGAVSIAPSPANLDIWLPRILGAAEVTDAFDLAETLQTFGVLIDREGETFEYTDCYVNRAIFRGRQASVQGDPQPIEMILEIVGKTEVTGTSSPALSVGEAANNAPYIFEDTTLTLQSGARTCMNFVLVIDNHIRPRFANSLTATDLTPGDRTVLLRTTNPFTSTEASALYGQSTAGATGTLVWTNGNMSTTWTFGKLQVPDRSPNVRGKVEIPLILDMVARKSGSDDEVAVTHDSVA